MTTLATDLVIGIGKLLTERGETVSVAESSAGGLIASWQFLVRRSTSWVGASCTHCRRGARILMSKEKMSQDWRRYQPK